MGAGVGDRRRDRRVTRAATPWHVWVVGAVALLWNAMGATDYVMTQTRSPIYLAMMTPAQLAWVASFPGWAVALWAVGVWGAIAGTLLLLARSRLAVAAFAVSLLGLAGTTLYQRMINAPPGAPGVADAFFTVALWAVAIALLVYARDLVKRRVLR